MKERREQKEVSFIIYYHDETNIHKNDHCQLMWCHKNTHRFLPKSKGKGYCISDFWSAAGGALLDKLGNRARIISVTGGNTAAGEVYWNQHLFCAQMEWVNKLHIDLYELDTDYKRYYCRPVWVLDNASTHTARAEVSFNAKKMNVGPGMSSIHALIC